MLSNSDYLLIAEHYATPHRSPEGLDKLDAPWIDSSKLADFHLCPQRYAYRYEEHLRRNVTGPDAAVFGTALHASLATLYKGEGWELVACPNHSPDLLCPHCRERDGQVPRITASFLRSYPWTEVEGDRTQEKGLFMLRHYVQKWRDQGVLQIPGPAPDVLAVERPFILVFRNENGDILFYYVGRIDLIRKDPSLGPVPEDHKSTAKYGYLFETQFRVSYQLTGYCKAVSLHYEEECYTAVVDALRVSKIISPDSFERFETQRYPEDFSQWETTVVSAMKQIAESRKTGVWERRQPFACTAYNVLCPYFSLCTASSPDHVETLKANAYHREVWNPLQDDDAPIPPDRD